MTKRLVWSDLDDAGRAAALARPQQRSAVSLVKHVRFIVDDIRAGGWDALRRHATVIDGSEPRLVPVAEAAEEARRTLSTEELRAINLAVKNITAFHKAQAPAETVVETMPGLTVRKVWRTVDRVGLYIPGGATPLFSTLLMLALPARAAGVREIVVCTPPLKDGSLSPTIALAADLCGITRVWTVGGAQAIAAMAFGAGDIPAVAKICGPGNAWVAEAKTYVASLSGGPAIDMPAGPSELMVIADDSADPVWVVADLLSQAEHDPSAQVLLATTSPALADAVEALLPDAAASLPRAEIAAASLAEARIILAADLDEAAAIANAYAPEHLCLALDDAAALVPAIRNAGAVFAGHGAAETFGDYLAGSSHVLPTDAAARAWSGINVHSFLKAMTVQELTDEAAQWMSAPAAALARLEGLEAHARAADVRSLPKNTAQAELVEALPFSTDAAKKESPSTSSGRAGGEAKGLASILARLEAKP